MFSKKDQSKYDNVCLNTSQETVNREQTVKAVFPNTFVSDHWITSYKTDRGRLNWFSGVMMATVEISRSRCWIRHYVNISETSGHEIWAALSEKWNPAHFVDEKGMAREVKYCPGSQSEKVAVDGIKMCPP